MSWTEEAEKRNCYCGVWDTKPAAFAAEGYPVGFCGRCEVCREPGHTRHYPGPVPYTGCWCDQHYAEEAACAEERFGSEEGGDAKTCTAPDPSGM